MPIGEFLGEVPDLPHDREGFEQIALSPPTREPLVFGEDLLPHLHESVEGRFLGGLLSGRLPRDGGRSLAWTLIPEQKIAQSPQKSSRHTLAMITNADRQGIDNVAKKPDFVNVPEPEREKKTENPTNLYHRVDKTDRSAVFFHLRGSFTIQKDEEDQNVVKVRRSAFLHNQNREDHARGDGRMEWMLVLPPLAVALSQLKIETLTISQVADLLGVSRQTVYGYIDRGELELIVLQGLRRPIRRVTVESFKRLREKLLKSKE